MLDVGVEHVAFRGDWTERRWLDTLTNQEVQYHQKKHQKKPTDQTKKKKKTATEDPKKTLPTVILRSLAGQDFFVS